MGFGDLGRFQSESLRRCSQGQEEVDSVVEMPRQPDVAEVHHHGQQVVPDTKASVEAREEQRERALHGPRDLPHPKDRVQDGSGWTCCGSHISVPHRGKQWEDGNPTLFACPPWGSDSADPLSLITYFSAVGTLSDTLRKMSASKKLWIMGSSAKEGRSHEALERPRKED
ncbi:hypothetical protein P7K49_029371 [Saguinus oedipus]|uniref:Uncharacterized protein n=1 Tax=Saguinus oedipus TaxID=9490 RepID=A0ABQ9U916_SAGOE|nr:hypothetical protein P7K49_029371 [Saguinus oedipus]